MYRTVSHPHGFFSTNKSKSFGFVRISKCGSNSFKQHFGLYDWEPFQNAQQFETLICAIRNPFDRFLSSIPETISRVRLPLSVHKLEMPYSGDVIVSPDVYFGLKALAKCTTTEEFLKSYIALIQQFGFFDAHHEPMINFLCDEKGRIQIDPYVFRIDVADQIAMLLPGFNHKNWKIKNSRQPLQQSPTAVSPFKWKNLQRRLQKPSKVDMYPEGHPLLSILCNSEAPVPVESHELKEKLISFYEDIQEFKRDPWFENFIRSYYLKDIWLYENSSSVVGRIEDLNRLSALPEFSDFSL